MVSPIVVYAMHAGKSQSPDGGIGAGPHVPIPDDNPYRDQERAGGIGEEAHGLSLKQSTRSTGAQQEVHR